MDAFEKLIQEMCVRDADGRRVAKHFYYAGMRAGTKPLRELYAMVKGECPALLNEDSGGAASLAIDIEAILAEADK